MFFTLLLVSIFYVISVNDLSTKGYVLYELKERIYSLQDDNDLLEFKTMTLQSYGNISERARELLMVKVEKVDYLTSSEEAVAKK